MFCFCEFHFLLVTYSEFRMILHWHPPSVQIFGTKLSLIIKFEVM